MAFTREVNVSIDSAQDFSLSLFVPGPLNTEGVQSGKIEVQLLRSDGKVKIKEADLLLRLQDDAEGLIHLSNLIDLRDYIRTRLNAEVIPVP